MRKSCSEMLDYQSAIVMEEAELAEMYAVFQSQSPEDLEAWKDQTLARASYVQNLKLGREEHKAGCDVCGEGVEGSV